MVEESKAQVIASVAVVAFVADTAYITAPWHA